MAFDTGKKFNENISLISLHGPPSLLRLFKNQASRRGPDADEGEMLRAQRGNKKKIERHEAWWGEGGMDKDRRSCGSGEWVGGGRGGRGEGRGRVPLVS